MARAASKAPNFSSSKVSMMMVRGTSGATASSNALAADRQVDGDPVAPTKVGGAFDHGHDGGVHPARAEGDDGSIFGGEPAPGRPRRHPRGLAEQPEKRRLVLGE